MRTVLGFDSWTEGARNYERLVRPLKDMGFCLKLVHFGSYGHDLDRPKAEHIGELQVYDISHFGKASIADIIRQEEAEAVVFLSTESFLHRAVNRHCRAMNVPTLHLYHGLISVQAVETGAPNKYRLLPQLKLVFERAAKNLRRILPLYVMTLLKTSPSWRDWAALLRNILVKVRGGYVPVAAPDATTDFGAVYAAPDVDHMHKKYSIEPSDIHVVGNPDLIKFSLKADDKLKLLAAAPQNKQIIYLDHGGTACGFTFASEAEFVDYLQAILQTCTAAGFGFSVKLHPAQYLTDVPEMLRAAGIALIDDRDFSHVLGEARAVLAGPTSVSMVPAFLGLEIMLLGFGPFHDQEYGESLLAYPLSQRLSSLAQLKDALSTSLSADRHSLEAWTERHIGPLPADRMPHRVAALVAEMVDSRKAELLQS